MRAPVANWPHVRPVAAALSIVLAAPVSVMAQDYSDMEPREGFEVIATDLEYADLLVRLKAAVPEAGMGLVTEAGPTEAAAGRGVTIPGNRVIGVFNNDFAVRILAVSTAAMIEAPIRFYVTENADGTATLSWKPPSLVLAPYEAEGGAELAEIAAALDEKFDEIATAATAQ